MQRIKGIQVAGESEEAQSRRARTELNPLQGHKQETRFVGTFAPIFAFLSSLGTRVGALKTRSEPIGICLIASFASLMWWGTMLRIKT